ncbi:MAG: (E)-4-hydroxy-3-methylbut-2-enyl-diphosphate synthase [Leptospiraceae bacterium]|nr:(E)-4-hydroxy-3-methylbut-2-enyl-diphosphate synthase [Leptospiraceae bacterium]MCB1304069.1 (E)-4-hydroxy-3-methylbut-2-enyl-diphosphate synthase [Leptospiraceae bacterium]
MSSLSPEFEPRGLYVDNPFAYARRRTREVKVGSVGVGGTNPIRIQSMTVSPTLDTEATVQEAAELFEAGCEIVRITAQGPKEARNLEMIRAQLNERGFRGPLVADIHFSPKAALTAVEYVEKVRINPGNFADTKMFAVREYSNEEYQKELERIHDAFKPLVLRSKELGRAMRIGVNHGSLSDRIMNQYGDTPRGMVESAIEFIKVAELYDYKDIIVSMKASNPQVMIQAYRMLVERFRQESMDYPLHLGVTEAGDGKDGRMKSACGIGALLEDGLGDTIRVSLTEDPIKEIPVARALADLYNRLSDDQKSSVEDWNKNVDQILSKAGLSAAIPSLRCKSLASPYRTVRRKTDRSGLGNTMGTSFPIKAGLYVASGQEAQALEGVDFIVCEDLAEAERATATYEQVYGLVEPTAVEVPAGVHPLVVVDCSLPIPETLPARGAYLLRLSNPCQLNGLSAALELILSSSPAWLALQATDPMSPTLLYRMVAELLESLDRRIPLVLFGSAVGQSEDQETSDFAVLYGASIHCGGLLLNGIGDGLLVQAKEARDSYSVTMDLLQTTRIRLYRTEYISCPSCGRTLFDLQETTARIRSRTGHLKGVKIAIMGCVVNGPGEMADADFGYVGSGPGKINLYRGKEMVRKNLPSEEADQALVDLIREHGMWQDP